MGFDFVRQQFDAYLFLERPYHRRRISTITTHGRTPQTCDTRALHVPQIM